MEYQNLVDSLGDRLAGYRYTEPRRALSVDGVEGIILATPRRMMVRYVCAIFCLSDAVETPAQAKLFFDAVRSHLTATYARWPYFKEIGTYLVLMCTAKLFEGCQGMMGLFWDRTGLHTNVMLGTVLVDRDRFESSAECTWGLFYSGQHFRAISATAKEWCLEMRSEQSVRRDAEQTGR